ncbi:hypothetical protein HRbin01_00686 [archaeon HR01]|nr:hypothetical protein HRbin01_00686 [archaeon HR01]
MERKHLTYIVFAVILLVSPIASYLAWRAGSGQPASAFIGIIILLAAIIYIMFAGGQAEQGS